MSDERLRIPPAYAATCDLCRESLDTRSHGVHQWTAGWVMQRAGGGGHGISCAEREQRWAHGNCVRLKATGLLDQGSLL